MGTRDSRGALDGPNRPETDSPETASDRQGNDLVRARATPRGEATRGAGGLIGGPPYQRTEYFAERAHAPAAAPAPAPGAGSGFVASRSAPRSPSPARRGNSQQPSGSAAQSQRAPHGVASQLQPARDLLHRQVLDHRNDGSPPMSSILSTLSPARPQAQGPWSTTTSGRPATRGSTFGRRSGVSQVQPVEIPGREREWGRDGLDIGCSRRPRRRAEVQVRAL